MAGSDNSMQLVFQASVGDVLKGIEQVKSGLSGLSTLATQGLGGDLPAATRRATEATNGVTESISRLTAEQRTQQRMVGFWVRDINEVVGASRGAQAAVGGFASALLELSGGISKVALGFAVFEVAKGLITFFREAAEEAKKAAESISSALQSIQDRISAIGKSNLQLKIIEAGSLQDALDQFRNVTGGLRAGVLSGELSGAEYASGWDAANEALTRYFDQYKLVGAARSVESLSQIHAKLLQEIERLDADYRTRDAVASAQAAEKRYAEQTDLARKALTQLAKDQVELLYQPLGMRIPEGAGTDQYRMMFGQVPGTTPETNRGSSYQLPGSWDSQKYWQNMTKDMWGPKAEDLANLRKAQEEFKQFKSLAEGVAGSIGSAFGDAFTSLLTGTKRVDEAIKELFQSILRSFVDMIAKMIAEALAASILRIILGIGTGGASAGAGVAGYASMFSFDSGSWSVPRTGLALIHQGEMVIPAGQAEAIRQGGLGGGGSPVNVTMNVQALDGASVYRVLRENETHLVRVLSEASRNGRL